MLFCQVILLATVRIHVVELPGFAFGGDEFPLAIADGAVTIEFEEEGRLAVDLATGETGAEAGAFHGVDVLQGG